MRRLLDISEHGKMLLQLLVWTLLVIPVGMLSGSASALFLWALDQVTEIRWHHSWLLFLLPLAGVLIVLMYQWWGKSAERGNNLIIEQIHRPGGGVPVRMAPLVLLGTLLTHLFGGSAGREGTAVQMGGSLANGYIRLFRIRGTDNLRTLLAAGVAAGFGSVFGTPLAGAVFSMEVLTIGRLHYEMLLPVLVASLVGDATCSAWGVHHTAYHISFGSAAQAHTAFDLPLLGKVVLASMAFGLASQFFSELVHALQHFFKQVTKRAALRPVLGALIVIALVYLLGTQDFLGLGVRSPDPHGISILAAFDPQIDMGWAWFWKTLLTAVTLASGFKGGEVTPLFFIGATLGHACASVLGAPIDLFAGLGFIAVFTGAANTPLACTLMGIELFGSQHSLYFAVACFVAYLFSGHTGIYAAQRLGVPKRRQMHLPPDASLHELRALHQERLPFWPSRSIPASSQSLSTTLTDITMDHPHIKSHELGKIRIYLTPGDRVPAKGFFDKLNGRKTYRELIKAAQQDGLQNAVAFMTHYGFTNGGSVQATGGEMNNPSLTLCVEIIDHRDALETFCRKHADLVKGKTIVYKHVEHWSLHDQTLVEEDSSPNEVIDGNKTGAPESSPIS